DGEFDKLITPGLLNALGLLHEIYHFIFSVYQNTVNPGVLSKGMNYLNLHLGDADCTGVLLGFIHEFPPLDVYKGNITPEDYLNGSIEGKPNSEILLEEIILLQLENINPASFILEGLYSDHPISKKTKYLELIDDAEEFFITEKPFGPENLPFFQFLRKPIVSSPSSIDGQLDFILQNWADYLPDSIKQKLLRAKDLILEDLKLFLQQGGGKGTPPVPQYKAQKDYFEFLKRKLGAGEGLNEDESRFYYSEIERFTEDIDWMPRVVMIAKNIFVWLDQISRKYQNNITRLDQIPDEELDRLASWNFTALWLIGIWERSSASKKIKQLTGNPEAASSAYSLHDYVIADELGGEQAFQNLKDRAWQRGIRLSSDMVPNHTGIYSKLVIEKPDYFIQVDYPPYPGYSFHGPNLSEDPRVEVRIEDKYYNKTDAAVVFQRRDSYTGSVKYIYHGNDGTHMPWNDTAQLNLLNPEVRESLIQTIMHVARKTPVIRFDAAMTLAKKHYQRLWFPKPGTGGAIPSRSDFSMENAEFDAAMPNEFWREVVDRINAEMPNTLLLAEAFWLMEGYFVRTLGMHRVYNSAFMHMLMKEENEKYRDLISNTLEFNPEILKRYVNFMSNPDEETAVNQFGKGDKYFGICVLMITLPGLPMFAHGQIEGFSEKYGMEYKRSYYNEFPDEHLIRRHEEEIFPLLRKRYLFSQVANFELYDFIDDSGNINENVYAFSNRMNDESALIIYNNSYFECKGTINYSAAKVIHGNHNHTSTRKLAEALGIKNEKHFYYIYRDHKNKLEFIFSGRELHEYGMFISLYGYQYKACLNFREIYDSSGDYERLNNFLSGRGVGSIEFELKMMNLRPVHAAFASILSSNIKDEFENYCFKQDSAKKQGRESLVPEPLVNELNNIIRQVEYAEHTTLNKEKIIRSFNENLSSIKIMSGIFVKQKKKNNRNSLKDLNESYISLVFLNGISTDDPAGLPKHIKENRELLLPLILLKILMNDSSDTNQKKDYLFDKLMLDRVLSSAFEQWGHNFEKIIEEINLVKILSRDLELYSPAVLESPSKTKQTYNRERMLIEKIFSGKDYLTYLNYNDFNGVKYYSKERFENLISWIFTLENLMKIRDLIFSGTGKAKKVSEKRINTSEYLKEFKKSEIFYSNIWDASGKTGYKAEELKEIFTPGKEPIQRRKEITSFGKKKTERAGNNEKNAKNVKRKIVTRRSK
ncbi:MAG: alpha-amylase family glycosyl hydrolase, partial [Ignavibacteria bacterium]